MELGLTLTKPWPATGPIRGNLELYGLLSGGIQHNDEQAYLVTLSPGGRHLFATGTRWVPYIYGSAGAAVTDMKDPDLNGSFQFDLRFGGGLRCYITPRTTLVLDYAVLHLSNGGTSASAHGVNPQMITLGLCDQF